MIVHLSQIPAEGQAFEGEEDADLLELKASDGATAAGPIRYRVDAQMLPPRLIVRGVVEVPLRAECCRCGVFFSTFVRDSAFLRDYLTRDGQMDVDVTPDLREAVLLLMPRYPVCSETCKGLCLTCGRNLNEGPCECRPSSDGGRWSALDVIRV